MSAFEYDRSSKWIISHHGGALLRMGGWTDVTSWRALPGEVAQPRRFPDGILEVGLPGRADPAFVGIEITTYPDNRVAEQVLRNLLLIYSDKGVVPAMLVLVLQPKGRLAVPDRLTMTDPTGSTELAAVWRVVRLWELRAEDLLATGDVGLVPWVPLTQFEGPVVPLLHRCRERLDAAPAGERANLLAVTQVLTRLRFADRGLLDVFGGSDAMIESPLIDELVSAATLKAARKMLLASLTKSLGPAPEQTRAIINVIRDADLLAECIGDNREFASWDDVRKWLVEHGAAGQST